MTRHKATVKWGFYFYYYNFLFTAGYGGSPIPRYLEYSMDKIGSEPTPARDQHGSDLQPTTMHHSTPASYGALPNLYSSQPMDP